MASLFTLGPLTVTPFGLAVFAGALCGVLLSLRKKENGPVLPFVILGALLIGHMWWVFFCPPGYTAEDSSARVMLRIWEGGYTLYGALAGGMIGAIVGAKLSGLNLLDVLDSLSPGACAALFFSRLGEYFTGQGYGECVYEESLWFLPVSFCTYQEEDWQEWRLAIWAWEAAVALILLVVLLLRARKAKRGQQAVLFISALGTSQIFLEQLRRDDFVRLNLFVRFSQIAALLSLIAVLVLLVCRRRPGAKKIIVSFAELTLASLSVVFAEFLFQKPQFDILLYIFAVLSAVGFAVLLRVYRRKLWIPASAAMLAATGALLALYITETCYDEAIYGLMAVALLAIGEIIFVNASGALPAEGETA